MGCLLQGSRGNNYSLEQGLRLLNSYRKMRLVTDFKLAGTLEISVLAAVKMFSRIASSFDARKPPFEVAHSSEIENTDPGDSQSGEPSH